MKLKFIIRGLILILNFLSINAQDTSIVWFKSYGGYEADWASSVIETYDYGYLVVGVSWSFVSVPGPFGEEPRPVIWLLRIDTNGDTLWTVKFNNNNNQNIVDAFDVKQTSDGGFIVIGSISSYSLNQQVLLFKTDSYGEIMWVRTYGEEWDQYGNELVITSDNGYLLLCNFLTLSENGTWIIKTNDYGDTLWTKKFLGFRGKSLKQTLDNAFIVSGQQVNEAWLMKVDSSGNIEWQYPYSSPCSFNLGNCVELTSDSGYIFSSANSICKTDSLGEIIWCSDFRECLWDGLFSVSKTHSQNYISVGRTNPSHTRSKFWMIKINNDGDLLWQKEIGESWDGYGSEVIQTEDGYYIAVGSEVIPYTSNTELVVIKIFDDEIYDIREPLLTPKLIFLSQNYPNPFNPSTKIKFEIPGQARNDNTLVTLKVYDLLGREIATLVNEEKPAGEYEVEFNAYGHSGEVRNLTTGIYFYQLRVGDFVETKKMVLIR